MVPSDYESNEDFLKATHHALLEASLQLMFSLFKMLPSSTMHAIYSEDICSNKVYTKESENTSPICTFFMTR